MSPIQNFEHHARQLVEPDLPIQMRLQLAMEVRDSLEIAHTAEYLNFLKCFFRAFSVILTQITTPQLADNPEHKLRNVIVEILNRLPHSEVLRPFVQDLLKVALQVLTLDNEENGLICIRIIFDLLRNFRPSLETEVQPFLDFVCKVYQNFRATVCYFFDDGAGGENNKPLNGSGQVNSGYIGAGQLNPSTRSFKIVTESPLVVMFLFQLYGRLVQTNIPHLLPLMVAAISVPGPEKVPTQSKNHFIELKGAQVKSRELWMLIPVAVCWVVWEERNKRTFEDQSRLPRIIIDAILSILYEWLFVATNRDQPLYRSWIFDWDSLIL